MYKSMMQAVCSETDVSDIDLSMFVGAEEPLHGVNELAAASVRAAVSSTQMFIQEYFGTRPSAKMDRTLVDRWCVSSVTPTGWNLPSEWDEFAKDYQARDGWIRLHTNASHHRDCALSVLGDVSTPEEAAEVIANWNSSELESAIVNAGGCAAVLRNRQEWQSHPQGIAVAQEPIVNWDITQSSSHHWKLHTSELPLSGLRVLDLTRVIAGPVATRFLANLGADVLRIDPPHWDEGGNTIDMAVGKTCAGLNLREPEDLSRLIELIKSAHVLVHGYRKDALSRLGLTKSRLSELNPALISVGVNAYGATGPWQNRRGFDSLVQRSSGVAMEKSGIVTALPYQALDHSTGYLTAATVMQALRLQHAGGGVASAHLSLARQAQILLDADIDHTAMLAGKTHKNGAGVYTDYCFNEQTDWGPVLRLPLPYEIEGVNLNWMKPAKKLRSGLPEFGIIR
ncbi:CoA transferase [Marinomonas sp. 2405UD66-6]|uniref:CoA transferase n=1 Tax=Marinomonas sp. 2405UD66-6 TaxID=3391834 RepID=UPI0039C90AC7